MIFIGVYGVGARPVKLGDRAEKVGLKLVGSSKIGRNAFRPRLMEFIPYRGSDARQIITSDLRRDDRRPEVAVLFTGVTEVLPSAVWNPDYSLLTVNDADLVYIELARDRTYTFQHDMRYAGMMARGR